MEEIFTIFFSGANIIVRAVLSEHFCPYRAQGVGAFSQGVALGYGVIAPLGRIGRSERLWATGMTREATMHNGNTQNAPTREATTRNGNAQRAPKREATMRNGNAQRAPKGQYSIAQGNALGINRITARRPVLL